MNIEQPEKKKLLSVSDWIVSDEIIFASQSDGIKNNSFTTPFSYVHFMTGVSVYAWLFYFFRI
jgi:hypothetical protein